MIPSPLFNDYYRLVAEIKLSDCFETAEDDDEMMQVDHRSSHIEHPKMDHRRRRKLPEIPSGKRPLEGLWKVVTSCNGMPLAQQELANLKVTAESKCLVRQVTTNLFIEIQTDAVNGKPISIKLFDREPANTVLVSTPESESFYKLGSDSGASSAHSPTTTEALSNYDSISSDSLLNSCKLKEATHRGLHKFVARHADELEFDVGDPIYVIKESDDMWYEGVNMRTGACGIFPSACVTDVDYSDFVVQQPSIDNESLPSPVHLRIKRQRFLLDFLGSIQVMSHKGNDVLCQSVSRVIQAHPSDISLFTPFSCVLEISDLGIRMTDKSKEQRVASSRDKSIEKTPKHDYFFALKHITFCGHHPDDDHYFGFITKHPNDHRFACHVFIGKESTKEVAECVGRAFHRFYNRFIEMAYPIEEFYFE